VRRETGGEQLTTLTRPLTVVSLDKLSAAIAAAVSEVAGESYSAEITHIDFESIRNSWMEDTTMLTVRLKAPKTWWYRSLNSASGAVDEDSQSSATTE
jgi:hypothetical protein